MKQKILIIILLVIICVSSLYSMQDVSEIIKDINEGRLEKALSSCENIISNPTNERLLLTAIFHKYRILEMTKKYAEALDFLNSMQSKYGIKEIPSKLLDTLPLALAHDITLFVPRWKSAIYVAQNKFEEGENELRGLINLLDKYIKVSQKEVTKELVYRKLRVQAQLGALLYNRRKQYDAAIKEFNDVIEFGKKFFSVDQETTDTLNYIPIYLIFVDYEERIGDIYKEQGQIDKALEHYSIALENMKKLCVPAVLPTRHVAQKEIAIKRLNDKINSLNK